jgi:hypothetical protein
MGRPGRATLRRGSNQGPCSLGRGVLRTLEGPPYARQSALKTLGHSAVILRSELHCGASGYSDR